jgi:sarcosine oxidase subunit beta
MRLTGSDGEFWSLDQLKREIPFLAYENARFPIYGAFCQRRGGTVRHDAVVWGFARAASALGVDILQKCEVSGIERNGTTITAIETSRGRIEGKKIAFSVAGSTSRLWQMAGLNSLPIETHVLQAFVTDPIKPVLDHVVTFIVGGQDFYISQSDKGGLVFGSDLDGYKSYAQRGNAKVSLETAKSAMSILPNIGRARLVRNWGGLCDMSMDGTHFMCRTPLDNLYLNAGWNYGGFKASPAAGWYFADLIFNERAAPPIARHTLERFNTGATIDEHGLGPTPRLHG